MALRPATDSDWEAITGQRAPSHWFGVTSDARWFIEGLGAVYLGTDGRWWLSMMRAPGIGKVHHVYRGARQLVAKVKTMGCDVYAIADPSIEGAEILIERLGFIRSGEFKEGFDVWTQ